MKFREGIRIFIYRIEITDTASVVYQVAVIDENEEAAFQHAENALRRDSLHEIEIKDIAIVQKKPVKKGTSLVFNGNQF